MKIAILGATGFIGRGLSESLTKTGHLVIALSRNPLKAKQILGTEIITLEWSPIRMSELAHELEGMDAFVNLAGENIGSFLWTPSKRAKIRESRTYNGSLVTELILSMRRPPEVLIQASAVGYYGTRGEEPLTESSGAGRGFLADVAVEWEKSTATVETSGVRYIITRSGVVLSAAGGALPKLAAPYKFKLGSIPGTGEQWLPWIHYQDEIGAFCFLLENIQSTGVYNLAAPVAARMAEVCREIGPTVLKVPNSLVRLVSGKMGEETILCSQRVVPEKLLKEGFEFKFRTIEEALANIYSGE